MDKKIIEKLVKETENRLEQSQEALVRAEIMERFARRKVLTSSATGNEMLVQTTKQISTLKTMLNTDKEFLSFLNEIKNEKE